MAIMTVGQQQPPQAPQAPQYTPHKSLSKTYDPSKVDETTRGMNEHIAQTIGRQWGHKNVEYDPTTGKVKTTGAYAGRAVDPAMYKYIERAKANFFKDTLRNKALENYQKFDVDKYVKGESDAYRRQLADQVMQSQNQLRGQENARGMLFSGRAQAGQSKINQAANQDFNQYRNNLVQEALKQKQALAADPLLGMADQSLASLQAKLQSLGG